MSAPAGLVGAALVLWGWSIGQLAVGIALGAAYEALRLAWPSDSAAARVHLVVRGCALAAVAALVYAIATQRLPGSLYSWLRWLPVVLLPVPAIGLLAGGVRASHLERALGRPARPAAEDRAVDATHAFAAVALAAAGTGAAAGTWLYPGFALVLGWAILARARPGRRAVAVVMLAAAVAFGHGIHTSLSLLQGKIEELSTEYLTALFTGKADPFRERTRIGELGRIKLSDRIVLRVAVEGPRPASLLLRESSFERYRQGEWRNVRDAPRIAAYEHGRWTLSGKAATSRLTVRRSMPGGQGLIALPMGTVALENLPAARVEAFPSGAVRVHDVPRFLDVTAAYAPGGDRDPPDLAIETDVPASLAPVLEQVVEENALRRESPARSVQAVRAFFEANFAYSLDLGDTPRTLGGFLLQERAGHCEYFATATVMLLRALGIPARYAAGYSVQEWSELEQAFVVRGRHAHAWAQAFVDGRWVEVDTTPARWADFDREVARGVLGPVLDAFSWLAERAVRAWLNIPASAVRGAVAWILVVVTLSPVAAYGLWRWRRKHGRPRVRHDGVARAWRAVERRIARMGLRRETTETVREWVERVRREPATAPWADALGELAALYYRVRFDPASSPTDAANFVATARRWARGQAHVAR